MFLLGLCDASTAHDACVHDPTDSPAPSKWEFKVLPFKNQQCHDSFSIM